MQITARFKCTEVKQWEGQEQLTFTALTSSEGNKSWSTYTPSGELKMTVTNPAIFGTFSPGVVYKIDIEPAVDVASE